MSSLDDAREQFTDIQNRKITELFHSIDLDGPCDHSDSDLIWIWRRLGCSGQT